MQRVPRIEDVTIDDVVSTAAVAGRGSLTSRMVGGAAMYGGRKGFETEVEYGARPSDAELMSYGPDEARSADSHLSLVDYDPTPEDGVRHGTDVSDAWMMDGLRKGYLSDPRSRFHVITGCAPEASGALASGYEYSKYDEDFLPGRTLDGPTILPTLYDAGLDLQEYKRGAAAAAIEGIDTYTPLKPRIVLPDFRDKLNMEMMSGVAARALEDDVKATHHVDVDRVRQALVNGETIMEQRAMTRGLVNGIGGRPSEEERVAEGMARGMESGMESGMARGEVANVDGTIIRPEIAHYEPHSRHMGPSSQAAAMIEARPQPANTVLYPQLAAYLLSRPTDFIKVMYRDNPEVAYHLHATLEKVAASTGELGESDRRTMEVLIQRHLDEMEVKKEFDPMMIQFVPQNDPRYVEAAALRDTYEKVYRIVCGEEDVDFELHSELIFPLAIQVRDRNIPITVENVIEERDNLSRLKVTLEHLATTMDGHLAHGGVAEYFDHASEEEREVMKTVNKEVIAMLLPGHVTTFVPIYNEEDETERVSRLMCGPQRKDGSERHAALAGGYWAGDGLETRTLADRVDAAAMHDSKVAPQDRPRGPEQLTYSGFSEGDIFIQRTALRKFVPPV